MSKVSFLESAFDRSATAMLVVDREGLVVRANVAFGEFTGRVGAELLGARWMDFLHPDDGAVIQESLARVLSGQAQSFRQEQRYRRNEGPTSWGDAQASLVNEDPGASPLFLVHILDITERRQREDVQRTHDYYQRALLDNFPFLVWLKDADNRLLAVNQAYADICGAASPEELLGKTDLDLWPEDLAQRYRADDQEVLRTRQKKSGEEPIEDRRGVRKWFEVYKAPVEDDQGKLYGTVGFSRDITDHRQVHQQLALIDFALNQVREAAFLMDESGRFHYVNNEACRSLGYSRDELLRMGVADIDSEWLAEQWPVHWANIKVHGSQTVERHHRTKDGCRFPVEITANYFEYGRQAYNLALVRDITERRQALQKLALIDFALNQVREAAFLIDENAHFQYVNDEACRSLGYSRDELLSMGVADIDPLWPMERWPAHWASIKLHGSNTVEGSHRAKDGRHFPVEITSNYFEYRSQAYSLALVRNITERVRVQAVIQDKEQRYREIFDNASDALYLLEVTEDGRFRNIEANPALATSVGMSRDELIGKFVDDTVASEAAQTLAAKYRRCIESGVAVEEEVELLLPVGRRTYHSTVIPVRNSAGRIHRIVGIRRDITQHKVNEGLVQQRLALEKLLARLIELTPGALGVYQTASDGTGHMPFFSSNHDDVIGISPQDWERDIKIVLQRLHPEDISHYKESYRESARTMSVWRTEYRIQHPRKGEIWIEGHFTPERQPDGEMRWYGFHHDVSARKCAERLLRTREKEFRTLAEHLPDMIVRLDRDCRRIYVNPAYERETGIPLSQAFNSTFEEVWWPTMPREAYKARLQTVMETGVTDQLLLERHNPDGETTSYEVRVVAEYDDDGRVLGLLAIGHNITAHQQAERALRASTLQVRELAAHRERLLEQERKRIAREVHDELGQLLSVLHLRIQILQATLGAGNPALDEQALLLATLVSKTQQVARDITSAIRPAALGMGVLAALEWQARELTRNTGIQCHVSGANVQMDEERATAVLRIVQESLTNALRHSGASAVKIMLDQQQGFYILKISDNGGGFEPGRPVKEKSFGLVGIRERALMLGGEIVITSSPQLGTSLQVHFPVEEVTGDPTP